MTTMMIIMFAGGTLILNLNNNLNLNGSSYYLFGGQENLHTHTIRAMPFYLITKSKHVQEFTIELVFNIPPPFWDIPEWQKTAISSGQQFYFIFSRHKMLFN